MKKYYKVIDWTVLWATILLEVVLFTIGGILIVTVAFDTGFDVDIEASIALLGILGFAAQWHIFMDKALTPGSYLYELYLNSSLWDKAYDLGVR